MNYVKRFFTWLIGLFIHEAVEQVKEEIKKPDTIEDEKTPENIKRDWNQYVADQLRDKDSGH